MEQRGQRTVSACVWSSVGQGCAVVRSSVTQRSAVVMEPLGLGSRSAV